MNRVEQLLSELLEELRELGVTDPDLRTALDGFFPFSSSGSGERSVHYAREGEHALTAAYNKSGELRELRPTSWMTEARFEELRQYLREALVDTVPRVARFVLFGLVPCTGAWRYRDSFQLLPVPDEAPKPPQILENQPLVLEVRYAGVEDPSEHLRLEVDRIGEAVKRVGLLLAGLIPRIEYRSPRVPQSAWGVDIDAGSEFRSKWVQLGYVFPEFVTQSDTFTDLSDAAPMPLTDTNEFYTRRGVSPENELIDLPDQLESLLDAFFGLPSDEADRFLHFCFWLNHAKQVGPLGRSAAHLAVVQAIEALVPREEDADQCETCGRSLGPGPTARFAQFLQDFALGADADQRKAHKELYHLRSALTHGGKLLQDELFERGMGLHPTRLHEDALLLRARLVAQVAAVNWLMDKAPHVTGG